MKLNFDNLLVVGKTKLEKQLKLFSAFICEVAQLSSSFSLAAMLKNVQESQNPLFKNSIKMEKQEKTCCFHLFRISKLLKLEKRDLHSLKDLFKSFPMVIYFSYFEENEEWFLKALISASFFFERLSNNLSFEDLSSLEV